jgi:hypothetical protein
MTASPAADAFPTFVHTNPDIDPKWPNEHSRQASSDYPRHLILPDRAWSF